MANIADGVYNATITAAAVYEKNGLKLELRIALCDENGEGYTETGTDGREYPVEKRVFYTLISAQGAVNTKVIEIIRGWAPAWDGTDPFWFTDAANTDAIGMIEATVKTEPSFSDPTKLYQNVRYLNKLGDHARRGGAKVSAQSGDKAAIMAKWGAKFKAAAAANPRPVSAASLAKSAAVAAPKAARAVPSAPAAKSKYADGLAGQAQAWDEHCALHSGESQEKLSESWFAALDKVAPGKDQQNLTGGEWQKVAEELAGLPF